MNNLYSLKLIRKFSKIPIVFGYIIFLLFSGFTNIIITPPFQVPDEPVHFMRAYQIAQGRLVGVRLSSTQSGAYLPNNIEETFKPFEPFYRNSDNKVNGTTLSHMFDMRWNTSYSFVNIPNSVVYPPTSYIGAVAAIFFAKKIDANPLGTFYLARIGNFCASAFLSVMALWIIGDAGAFLLILLTLPMCTNLEASCSQDSILLGLTALAVAIFIKFSQIPTNMWSKPLSIIASVCIGCIISAKLPYFTFAFLPFLLCPAKEWKKPFYITSGGLLLSLVWILWGLHYTVVLQGLPGSSISGQIYFLFHNPLKLVDVPFHNIMISYKTYCKEMIGVLGWLSVPLPKIFYTIAKISLILSFVFTFCIRKNYTPDTGSCFKIFYLIFIVFSIFYGVCMSLYLIYTPVGSNYSMGVQGRYFLPAVMIFALSPTLLKRTELIETSKLFIIIPCLLRIFLLFFMTFSFVVTFKTLYVNYW